MNKYDQIFNEKLGELLKDVIYPIGAFSPRFLADNTFKAMECHTETTLQCTLSEYEKVAKWAMFFTMPEMAEIPLTMPVAYIALEACMSLSPLSRKVSLLTWVDHKMVFDQMKSKWDTTAAPYIKEATEYAQKIAKRDQRELEAKSKLKGVNGKTLAFPT